jgi:hypothetical protein
MELWNFIILKDKKLKVKSPVKTLAWAEDFSVRLATSSSISLLY